MHVCVREQLLRAALRDVLISTCAAIHYPLPFLRGHLSEGDARSRQSHEKHPVVAPKVKRRTYTLAWHCMNLLDEGMTGRQFSVSILQIVCLPPKTTMMQRVPDIHLGLRHLPDLGGDSMVIGVQQRQPATLARVDAKNLHGVPSTFLYTTSAGYDRSKLGGALNTNNLSPSCDVRKL